MDAAELGQGGQARGAQLMPMPAYTRTAIVQALRQHGPQSAENLAEVLGLRKSAVKGALSEARGKYGTKFFRIAGWRRYTGRGSNWVPIYACGPGEDVARPVLTAAQRNERHARYRARMRDVIRIRNRVRRGVQPGGMWAQLLARSNP